MSQGKTYRLISIIACVALASIVIAQDGMFFHVLRHDRTDTLEMKFETSVKVVREWQDNYGPNLFAYPLKYWEVLDVKKYYALSFNETERVFLRLTGEDPGGGNLKIVAKDGAIVWQRRLTPGPEEYFIEIPVSTFGIRFEDMGEEALVKIERVYLEPQPEQQSGRDFGFGTSLPCHINTACGDADLWRDQTRSAVRIRMVLEEGIGWCSGTLVNNTAMDGRPLILSAEHCLGELTPLWNQWRFDFNYAAETCENPAGEPVADAITGCSLLAKQRDTDFLLLELNEEIPPWYGVYFAGWNRTPDYEPAPVALIHHPSGDIRKVTRDVHPFQLWENEINWTEGYSTPPQTHFRSRWDYGVFEAGSSGGGIFDPSGLIIGQLHGGSGDCNSNFSFAGQFPASWNYGPDSTGRLIDWLDPLSLDTLAFPGMEHPAATDTYHLTIIVRDPQGRPMTNLDISVSGGIEFDVQTDSAGTIVFETLPRSETLLFSPHKNSNPRNGVSATDLLLIKKHLLGVPTFPDSWQVLASDATGNETVSVSDILILQKLLLGLVPQFPSQTSWVFDPPAYQVFNPDDSELILEFTAIKVGDVNGTADPEE